MPKQSPLNTPAAMLDAPQPPTGMAPAAKAMWRQLVATRASSQWSASDLGLLAMYIAASLDVERLSAEIAKYGEVVDGKVSPRVQVRNTRENRVLALAGKLKLLPSNRYTNRDVARMHTYAQRNTAANDTADSDDLLAPGLPARSRLQ